MIVIGVPIAIMPARLETYDTTPKLTVLYLSLAFLLWLPNQWWPRLSALWRTPAGRKFYFLLIIGAASLLVAAVFSNDPWLSFAGTVWRRMGAINQTVIFFVSALIGGYVYSERTMAKTLMLAMEAAGAITSVYAILQYAGWDPLIPRIVYTIGAVVRPPATLVQATYFATFLLPTILIAIGFRLHETSSSRWKRTHEIVLFISMSALILTGTRSALLGLGAGACVLIYMEKGRIANRTTIVRASYLALAFSAAAAVFLLLPSGKDVRQRIAQWATDPAGGPRLLVWRDSTSLFLRHPVTGIGPELFEAEFRRAESVELARSYPDHYHESPHNFFLEAATGEGMTGLVVWLALLGLASYCGILCWRRADSYAAMLLAALMAMLISLQFCPLTMTNEMYLLGLSAMLIALAAPRLQPKAQGVNLSPFFTGCARAFSVALVIMASAYVVQAALYASTESRAVRADLPGAQRSYQAAREFPMPGPNLAVSRQIATLSGPLPPALRDQALIIAKEAAGAAEFGMAERFNGLYQSATLAILTRDLPQAETKLRAAIDAAPAWYRPRMALACVLWWRGKSEEAQREAALATDYSGTLSPNVKRTLDGARAQARLMAIRGLPFR